MARNKQAPTAEKRTVARKREYLIEAECEKLLEAAKGNRYGHRDYTMLLAVWRQAAGIRSLRPGMERYRLSAGGVAHPPGETRQARRSPYPRRRITSFAPIATRAGAEEHLCVHNRARRPHDPDALNRIVKRFGDGSKLLGIRLHVHMLRHACGYKLANDGHDTRLIQDYLGTSQS